MTFWDSITKNWKTSLTGIVTFLLSVPGIVSALQSWANHQPVDWRNVVMSIALAVGGSGLLAAKDSTTHSTIAQVQTATAIETVEAVKAEVKDAAAVPPKP